MLPLFFFIISFVSSTKVLIPTNGYMCIAESGFRGDKLMGSFNFPQNVDDSAREVSIRIMDELSKEVLFVDRLQKEKRNFIAQFSEDEQRIEICFIDSSDRRSNKPIYVEFQLIDQDDDYVKKDNVDSISFRIDDAIKTTEEIKHFVDNCVRCENERSQINGLLLF